MTYLEFDDDSDWSVWAVGPRETVALWVGHFGQVGPSQSFEPDLLRDLVDDEDLRVDLVWGYDEANEEQQRLVTDAMRRFLEDLDRGDPTPESP